MKIAASTVLAFALLAALTACKKEEATPATPPASAPTEPAKVTVYTCSAHPDVAVNAPGKCPQCQADLVVKQ